MPTTKPPKTKPPTTKAPKSPSKKPSEPAAGARAADARPTKAVALGPVARSAEGARRWLIKSEAEVYGIADLERDAHTAWEGVRNYQARNFMRDGMRAGDLVLFYHSNAEPSGVAGVARVHGPALPDPTQFDATSEYFDGTSSPREPRWMMVPFAFVERFAEVVPLEVLKADAALADMLVVQKGQRLSVQPVSGPHFARVLGLAGAQTKA